MMGIARESFDMSADEFWSQTPHEWWSAIEARRAANKR